MYKCLPNSHIIMSPSELITKLKAYCFEPFSYVSENEIDIETLKELDDDHLKDLLPVIAQRIQFKKKLVEWKDTFRKGLASNTEGSQFSLHEFVNLETTRICKP